MPDPLNIHCSYCLAAPGRPCRTYGGKERGPHVDRLPGRSLRERTGWILRQQRDRDEAKAGRFGLGPHDEGSE